MSEKTNALERDVEPNDSASGETITPDPAAIRRFVSVYADQFKRDTHGGTHYVLQTPYGTVEIWEDDLVVFNSTDDEYYRITVTGTSKFVFTSPLYNLIEYVNQYGKVVP